MIESGELTEGHGRAILQVQGPRDARRLAREARDDGLSVRETERRAREAGGARRARSGRAVIVHPDLAEALAAAEDTLAAALGRDVSRCARRGEGCGVELAFEDLAEAVALAAPDPRRGRLSRRPRAAVATWSR